MPFLTNLYKSREQAYIHWPNRGNLLEKQILCLPIFPMMTRKEIDYVTSQF